MTVKSQITNVGVDTCYSCHSEDKILTDMVNMTLSSVLIQAFVIEGNKSENSKCSCSNTFHPGCNVSLLFVLLIFSFCYFLRTVTSCSADVPVTTPPPTTPPPTTQGTNATTPAPVTNTTSPAPPPTPTPTPTLPPPNTGEYSVNLDNTPCLLANFGLRIGIKQGEVRSETPNDHTVVMALRFPRSYTDVLPQTLLMDVFLFPLTQTYQEMNLEPNKTTPTGWCGVNSSELQLVSSNMTIVLTFINVSP